jgi:5,10-methylene-tetrahydrofolate dehydrogenase/methenyl tetrahydrofolate cyclohydrolase
MEASLNIQRELKQEESLLGKNTVQGVSLGLLLDNKKSKKIVLVLQKRRNCHFIGYGT